MRVVQSWNEKIGDKEGLCVWSICFSPDGSRIIIAAGNRVLVYNQDGSLVVALKGHKDTVYCVDYAGDGQYFASGSADKNVIIWNNKLEGTLKYAHNDAIQCLQFNPVTFKLASCAVSDFGLWSVEEKSVVKHKVSARITCCSWTADGKTLALGMSNGIISIRGKDSEEKKKIERPGEGSIWAMNWNPVKDEQQDTLVVADWNQTLSFYSNQGKTVHNDRQLAYNANFISWYSKGEYFLVGGSDGSVSLFSKDGTFLHQIAKLDSCVWCAKVCSHRNDGKVVTLGCQDGTVSCYQLSVSTVHGLYQDRYAFRDTLTDVIIQHLITDEKVRIKCRDLVKKIAIYRNRLAIQLTERIVIYELSSESVNDMKYRIKEKIHQNFECNLLVVCSNNVILCQEKKLQCLSFKGIKEKEWVLDSIIRYIKVIGGPAGREGLLVGLKNGQIMKIFVDNAFPIQILKQNTPVRCLDISMNRKKLAVVDEHQTCLVYNLETLELLYQEPNAMSVVWNTQFDDMLCFSGNDMLSIKASKFDCHQQRLQGFVVGYSGSKIFCLQSYTMSSIDVPQSAPMYQYLEKKLFNEAFLVACLGVTDSDWEALAHDSLEGLNFEVAKKSFIRIKDLRYLELIESIEERQKCNDNDPDIFLADIRAYQGKFGDAARLYKKAGVESRAMTMYTDLRMFDNAKEFIGSSDTRESRALMAKQADWASHSNEPKIAAQMYINAGDYLKAVEIYGRETMAEQLIDLVRRIDKADREPLSRAGWYFRQMNEFPFAAEVYTKMGDNQELAKLYVEAQSWPEAFELVNSHPELKNEVYLPYARWLAESDRFEEAQQAFHKAGMESEAVLVLQQLTHNAVNENRFNDAGYYYHKLSTQCLELAKADKTKKMEMLKQFRMFQKHAEIYYGYHFIQRFLDEPFTATLPEALFGIARFIILSGEDKLPPGISKVCTLYTLAKQSGNLGAYKAARYAYEKLQLLKIPPRLQEVVDLESVKIRSKPFNDQEDKLPMCYRCSVTNPLIGQKGNRCISCLQPFVNCFVSFEILPLVEFKIEDGIGDEEALQLLELEPRGDDAMKTDPFISHASESQSNNDNFKPIVVGGDVLKNMSRTEVIICQYRRPLKYRYYKNLMPDVAVTNCKSCNKLFLTDDFELQTLQLGHCPFCRFVEDK